MHFSANPNEQISGIFFCETRNIFNFEQLRVETRFALKFGRMLFSTERAIVDK